MQVNAVNRNGVERSPCCENNWFREMSRLHSSHSHLIPLDMTGGALAKNGVFRIPPTHHSAIRRLNRWSHQMSVFSSNYTPNSLNRPMTRILSKPEKIRCILITDLLDNFTDQLHIRWNQTFLYIITKNVADNPAEIIMAGIRQEAS